MDDGPGWRLPLLDAGAGLVEGGLQLGDPLVEHCHLGGDVSLPALVGVGLPSRPHGHLLAAGATLPPPGAVVGGPLGPLPLRLGVGQVTGGPPGVGARPDTRAGIRLVRARVGLFEGLLRLAQCDGPVRQADVRDGRGADGPLGMEEGGHSGLLVGRKRLEAVPLSVAGSGTAVSRAEVGVRRVDQSRRRSSTTWGRSSATAHWVESRARDMAR